MRSDIVFVQNKMKITSNMLRESFPNSWASVLNLDIVPWNNIADVLNKDLFSPKFEDIFAALASLPPSDVRVVILGQDPYPTAGVAHGYSFSVQPNAQIPGSLRNIHLELMNEYGLSMHPLNGSLLPWVRSGVLLLNTVLTVQTGYANSHKDIGWDKLTSQVIKYVDSLGGCVFLAWGKQATDLCNKYVTRSEIVSCGHPSPINTRNTFAGSNCFKKVNEILMKRKQLPIVWTSLWTTNRLE